jgi:flagellar biosynthesis protein FlhF
MKLKSYFSASVEAAMEQARIELGEDALLVNARPASPETRYLGAYEVVFGVLPDAPSGAAVEPDRPALAEEKPQPTSSIQVPADHVNRELADLRRQLESLTRTLASSPQTSAQTAVQASAQAPTRPGNPTESSEADPLLGGELDPVVARRIRGGAKLEMLFRVAPMLGRNPGDSRSVVALVGPPGAGKTVTLAKLAARFGLAGKRPTQILSADVNRIGAVEQLRTVAALLGVAFDVAETPLMLAQQLEEHRGKGLVLIDTPGFTFRDLADVRDPADGQGLAGVLANNPEIDTHLVLSASMKPFDLTRVCDAYAIFRPAKLLFTHLDETSRYGALVSEAARRDLPISFLATGQQIPDDLEAATTARLSELVLASDTRRSLRMGAAA